MSETNSFISNSDFINFPEQDYEPANLLSAFKNFTQYISKNGVQTRYQKINLDVTTLLDLQYLIGYLIKVTSLMHQESNDNLLILNSNISNTSENRDKINTLTEENNILITKIRELEIELKKTKVK